MALVAILALTGCPDTGTVDGGGMLKLAPVANAGPDQNVPRGALVTLDGTRSAGRRGGGLGFRWTQTAGPEVALSAATDPRPTFVAPATSAALRFTLRVSEGGTSAEDEVVVVVGDLAPVITSLVLGPPGPITTDTLVATASVYDPDPGDSLTLAWEWRRNGARLDGEGASTLSPSFTHRGDLFEVTLRASDGLQESTATARVTIQDAPATLTISAPDTVAWGAPLAFSAAIIDPDGDAVGPQPTCVLRRGPAGMTVSPACEGSWTPTLPMFERELAVTFEVGVAGTTAGAAERTVRVLDPARRYPLRRTGLDIPVQQNGLVAIDPDGDGTSTLLVAAWSGLYELAYVAGTYQQVWSAPFASVGGSPTAVDARDVDGDGRPEVFVASAAGLVKLDGVDRREVGHLALGCLDLEVADLDRDGAPELACLSGDAYYGSTQRLVVVDPVTLTTRWESATLALGSSLAVGNVDRDAALEIVTAGGYVFDGATYANEWASSTAFGQAVDTGDLDGDGVEEIVGMDAWSRFRGFSAIGKSPLWEQATSDNDALLVADVDRDGVSEIVVGDGQWGNVTAYRYRPGTNDLATVFAVDSRNHGVTSLAVADLDGDGLLELAWGTGASSSGADDLVIAGHGPAMAVAWITGNPSQLEGPFLGAVPARTTAGGAPALLFQTPESNAGYGGSRLVRMDPSGAVSVSVEIGSNWSRNGALAAADFDGDGVDEAFLATASLYDGYVVAWDFAAGAAAWSSPPGTADGRAIVAADLNADGAPDLVTITSDGYVVAYDPLHQTLLFKSTSIGAGVDLAVADLDGSGTPEIVALSTGRVVVFEKASSGPVPWLERASVTLSGGVDLEVADCDRDGTPEIYVLVAPFWSGETTVHRLGATLASAGTFAVPYPATSLHVEDLGPSRRNLILAKSGGSYGAATPVTLEAVDAVTGGRIWQSPPLWGTVPPNSLHYVGADGGGRAIAFGTTLGMYLTR